jgi:hypothetical protein
LSARGTEIGKARSSGLRPPAHRRRTLREEAPPCGAGSWRPSGRRRQRVESSGGQAPKGVPIRPSSLPDGTPRALVGRNKPTTVRKEQTPEGVRNAERGTNRDLGTPGWWTSGTTSAEGKKTLGELVASACGCGSRLRSYSEEEAEAQESRARCFAHRAGRSSGRPQEPRKAAGGGLKTQTRALPTSVSKLCRAGQPHESWSFA